MKQTLLAVADPFTKAADLINQSNPQPGTTPNLLKSVGVAINFVLGTLGIIGLILLVYVGILWLTTKGERDKVDEAKRMFKYTIWGLIVIILAYSLSTFIFGLVLKAGTNP